MIAFHLYSTNDDGEIAENVAHLHSDGNRHLTALFDSARLTKIAQRKAAKSVKNANRTLSDDDEEGATAKKYALLIKGEI